jgi:hypothetical protein
MQSYIARSRSRFAIVAVLALFAMQPGCLFRKKKVEAPDTPPAPTRIVLLPLNAPADNADLRWYALAAPVLLAKAAESGPDLEVVPLWEALPVALETLGSSRAATEETAAFIAARMGARWSAIGEVSAVKDGISVLVDFIPAKASLVPFRYQEVTKAEKLGGHLREAVAQLQSYLNLRPLKGSSSFPDPKTLKEIAEALDREYGWFVQAEPGKSDKVVADLARSDNRLARFLFSPTMYPALSRPAAGSSADEKTSSTNDASRAPAPEGAQKDLSFGR